MTDAATRKKIDAYFVKHTIWQGQLGALRKVLNESGLEETLKWQAPTYTLDGKIVASLAGFKQHCALWFHNGVYLKDTDKLLVNAQQGTTKALRQWRFEEGDKVPVRKVKAYVKEAMENERQGKRIKAQPRKAVKCAELEAALAKNSKLKKAFGELTPGKQKEYAEHIAGAKQEKTRLSRLEKATPLILDGKGLYDKYKNC